MSEPDKRKKRTPLKSPSPEKFQPRVLLIWMVIFAAIVGLWFMNPANTASVRELKLSEVIAAASRGDVRDGLIKSDSSGGKDWTIITGKLRTGEGELVDFRAAGRVPDASFRELQDTGAFTERPAGTVWQQVLIGLLPFVVIIGLLYFLFVRQIRIANQKTLNFGKSRAKMLTRDRDRITFTEVAGCDEAKEEVQEIVEFLKDPKKFQKVGGRIPKGILMVGPPGTDKTLLTKAIAGEADVPFFTISGSDFVEMFVGVGASRVRDMFEQGRKNAPCLIFIDEIDAVGRQRGAGLGGGNDEREQTLNSLLVEMDGFDTTEGVIIIAATNRPDVLDAALLRPGRFDRQIYIDLPDLVGREQILRVHARKLPLSEDVDLAVIARGTPGLSGAELANLLNEAALMAARRNKKKIEMTDIEDAREKVQFGRERRRIMDDEDKKIVAYHEVGYALVQAVVDDGNLPVHKVTIIPRGGSLGSTMFIPKKDMLNYGKRRLLNQLAGLMGGRAAEEVAIGDITSDAAGDIKQATKIARHIVCDWGMSPLGAVALGENQETLFLSREISRTQNYSESTAVKIDSEISRIVDEQHERAKKIVLEKRQALDVLAASLLEHETLEGRHVMEILEFGEVKTPVSKPELAKPDAGKSRPARDEGSKKSKDVPHGAEPTAAPA